MVSGFEKESTHSSLPAGTQKYNEKFRSIHNFKTKDVSGLPDVPSESLLCLQLRSHLTIRGQPSPGRVYLVIPSCNGSSFE